MDISHVWDVFKENCHLPFVREDNFLSQRENETHGMKIVYTGDGKSLRDEPTFICLDRFQLLETPWNKLRDRIKPHMIEAGGIPSCDFHVMLNGKVLSYRQK